MSQTKIEWADAVWNPVTGCTPVSEGCQNCYARHMATRLRGRYGYPTAEPFRVTLHEDRVEEPLRWRKPKRIFVCSMGDLFHPEVPEDYIIRVITTAEQASTWIWGGEHIFLFLTKRPKRMRDIWLKMFNNTRPICPERLWLGVSVEHNDYLWRVEELLKIPTAVHFVSMEPMLGDMNIFPYLEPKNIREQHEDGSIGLKLRPSVKWIICGGETGPRARPMHPDWVRSLRDQCQAAGVPFFFKSWGEYIPSYDAGKRCDEKNQYNRTIGDCWVKSAHTFPDGQVMVRVGKKAAGRLLDGRTWDEVPTLQKQVMKI